MDPSFIFWRLPSSSRRELHEIKKGHDVRVKVLIPLFIAVEHGLVKDLNAPDTYLIQAHGVITEWNCIGFENYDGLVVVDPNNRKNAWSNGGESFDIRVDSKRYLMDPLEVGDHGWVVARVVDKPNKSKKRKK